MNIVSFIFYGLLAVILLLCLEIVVIGILYVQRVAIDWLFDFDYVKTFYKWINKIKEDK